MARATGSEADLLVEAHERCLAEVERAADRRCTRDLVAENDARPSSSPDVTSIALTYWFCHGTNTTPATMAGSPSNLSVSS